MTRPLDVHRVDWHTGPLVVGAELPLGDPVHCSRCKDDSLIVLSCSYDISVVSLCPTAT